MNGTLFYSKLLAVIMSIQSINSTNVIVISYCRIYLLFIFCYHDYLFIYFLLCEYNID